MLKGFETVLRETKVTGNIIKWSSGRKFNQSKGGWVGTWYGYGWMTSFSIKSWPWFWWWWWCWYDTVKNCRQTLSLVLESYKFQSSILFILSLSLSSSITHLTDYNHSQQGENIVYKLEENGRFEANKTVTTFNLRKIMRCRLLIWWSSVRSWELVNSLLMKIWWDRGRNAHRQGNVW